VLEKTSNSIEIDQRTKNFKVFLDSFDLLNSEEYCGHIFRIIVPVIVILTVVNYYVIVMILID
jgi:hypothetical protein